MKVFKISDSIFRKLLTTIVIQVLYSGISAQDIQYSTQIVTQDSCLFVLADSTLVLDVNSITDTGTVEESLVELYLNQDYPKYWHEYSDLKEYWFLAVPKDKLEFVSTYLQFRLISKFFYKIDNQNYCLVRMKVMESGGQELYFHSRLIYIDGLWKSANIIRQDVDFINKLTLWFDHTYLSEILIDFQSSDPYLNDLINNSKDTNTGHLILEELVSTIEKKPQLFKNYFFDRSHNFKLNWWKKYL